MVCCCLPFRCQLTARSDLAAQGFRGTSQDVLEALLEQVSPEAPVTAAVRPELIPAAFASSVFSVGWECRG